MASTQTTSWGLIECARDGEATARAEFARRYERLIRDFLGSRWAKSPLRADLDDAVQEVFVECFREGGILAKAQRDRPSGFRGFFYGVVRNVALRHEKRRRVRKEVQPTTTFDADALPTPETSLSKSFDRAWAQDVLRRAVALMDERARAADDEARKRVQILRLRFEDGLPIRDIAKRWGVEAILVHRQYTKARREFETTLSEVLGEGQELPKDELERELGELERLLGTE